MKIAYVFCPIPHHGKLNGIISQCLTWADGLRGEGHEVSMIVPWESYDWKNFDVVHIFGSTDIWFYSFIKGLLQMNEHIIWSPICDNIDSPNVQYLKSLIGCEKLGIFSLPYVRKLTYRLPIKISARSQYERNYISKSYKVPLEKFDIVPLGMTYDDDIKVEDKEPFCFHISTLYQPRKNVLRLVKAAKKYHFTLVLAGSMGSEEEFFPIKKEIGDDENITVLGRISEEEKKSLYKRAKVFALPSISEGVGIVALDAAHFGCDIVITNIGGPQEYYPNGMVWKVNPFDVDEIGQAVVSALNSSHQPVLKNIIDRKYNGDNITQMLLSSYIRLLKE